MFRAIRVVDFETVGLAPPAKVIEAGWCDLVQAADGWQVFPPRATLHGADRITCETRAVHHIGPDDIAGREPFSALGFVKAAQAAGVQVLAAHHADFEGQWLGPVIESHLICTYKAALRVWPDAPSHSNQCLRYWLEEQGLATIDPALAQPAHRAGPDAYATAHLLKALLTRVTVEDMIRWTAEPKLLPTIPIGKQRGAKWPDVEEGFLRWMLRTADMDPDLKWNAQRELGRRSGL